jgi:predicted DNA-binding transcriptional regulator AlpA
MADTHTLSPFEALSISEPRDDDLVTSREVRRMFGGVSEMTLWRWMRSESVQFPKPITISGKNYWYLGDLRRFRERCASRNDMHCCISRGATPRGSENCCGRGS